MQPMSMAHRALAAFAGAAWMHAPAHYRPPTTLQVCAMLAAKKRLKAKAVARGLEAIIAGAWVLMASALSAGRSAERCSLPPCSYNARTP